MRMLTTRVLMVVVAVLAALVLVPVLVWDLAIASRVTSNECIVYGESAELMRVERTRNTGRYRAVHRRPSTGYGVV